MNIQIWKRSLVARMLLAFSALLLMSIMLLGIVAYIRAHRSLREAALTRLETIAILKENELNRWVLDQQQQVLLISALPEMRRQTAILVNEGPDDPAYQPAYQALSQQITLLALNNPNVAELFILHPVGGKVLVSSQKNHEGQYHVNAPYFTAGRQALSVQNIYPSPETGRPTLTVSAPIYDETDTLTGVIVMHVDLMRLDEVLMTRTGLGETGEVYLVDRFNVPVSASLYGSAEFPRGVHSQGIDAAVLEQQDGVGAYVNMRGRPVFGAYRWIDDREIALLVEVAQAEALKPAYELASALALAGLVFLLLLLNATYLLARQISRPILAFTKTVQQVAEGALDIEVPVLSEDEIGILAQGFREMLRKLRRSYEDLERQVEERTAVLKRRNTQITAAAEVSREVLAIRDVETLLQRVVTLISERFGYYHVGIFLMDENREYAVLRAASSEGGRRMLERQHRLEVGRKGIVGYVAAVGEPRIALDVGEDAAFFNNPDLPDTRSEMALPLRVRGEVLGVLDVQSTEPEAFTEEDAEVLQVMADQLAVAIDNARLFQASEQRMREINLLLRQQAREGWQRFRSLRELPAYAYDGIEVTELPEHEALPAQYAAPLEIRGEPIGRLGVLRADRPLEMDDLELVRSVAEQTSLALENARLFMETQASLAEIDVLYRASQSLGEAHTFQGALAAFMEYVGTAVLDRAVLLLGMAEGFEGTGDIQVMADWSPQIKRQSLAGQTWFVPLETVFARAVENPVVLEDVASYRVDRPSQAFLRETLGFYSVVILPLRLGARLLGWVVMGTTREPYQPEPRELRLYRSLSDRLAVVIEGLRLLEATMERAERERMAAEVAAQLRSSLDPDTILQTAARELGRIFETRWVSVRLNLPSSSSPDSLRNQHGAGSQTH